MLALSDWLLLATIVLVVPVYSYFNRRRLETIADAHRRSLYLRSMAALWMLALVTLYAWWRHDRPFDALGFQLLPGIVTTSAEIVCVMAAIAIVLRLRTMAAWSPQKTAALRGRIGGAALVVPRTKGELALFLGARAHRGDLRRTALSRVFLRRRPRRSSPSTVRSRPLQSYSGSAHAYQGVRRMALVAAVGLFLGAFYFLTGSIVFPMILHVLIDINGGVSGYLLLRSDGKLSGA